MATFLRYRGVKYDPTRHEQLSNAPVDHVYRGHHYDSAPRHEATAPDSEVVLTYRGVSYHHRKAEAARQVQQA
ncbi:MAG: DUF4278 domain-containing protein [Cyanobacteriota bacterium]|nr:DUF4278 domain-containing protein [Cyanobacteriota bacterium]